MISRVTPNAPSTQLFAPGSAVLDALERHPEEIVLVRNQRHVAR